MAVFDGTLGALIVAAVAAVALTCLSYPKAGPDEPPLFHSRIPFIGHLIGMIREGPLYYSRLSAKRDVPIFGIPIFGATTYVCTSPVYAALIQRASTTLNFDQLVARLTPRMVGSNQATKDILLDIKEKGEGDPGVIHVSHGIINPPLTATQVDGLGSVQLEHFSNFINGIGSGEVELFKLVTRELSIASMNTFYGPYNAFAKNPKLVDSLWDWERNLFIYCTGVLPSVFARKASAGLEACVQGILEYWQQGHGEHASELIRKRQKLHESYGITLPEHARLEMGLLFGFLSNAGIVTFWVLNNIYSRPALLARIRQEVRANALEDDHTIVWSKIKAACPLLNSVFRESMRVKAPMTSARIVMQDTQIGDYRLRKGAVVQIAGGVLHAAPSTWGPDASTFNPERFLHSANGAKANADGTVSSAKSDQVHASAFRGFGGGSSMCPGRHFAQMEVLSLTAGMIMALDVVPPEGRSAVAWDPPTDEAWFSLAVNKPVKPVDVRFKPREGTEGVKWLLKV